MAQQIINTGSNPNDGSGDPLRTAFIKTEENFTELFASSSIVTFPYTGSAQITGSLGVTGSISTNGDLLVQTLRAGSIENSNGSAKMVLGTDSIEFKMGINEDSFFKLDGDTRIVTINDTGVDTDFVVKGSGAYNLLYANAGLRAVGIGTNNPQKDLHVVGSVSASQYFGDLVDSEPAADGQFYYTASEAIIPGASGFKILLIT